jgi:hypothetical protein
MVRSVDTNSSVDFDGYDPCRSESSRSVGWGATRWTGGLWVRQIRRSQVAGGSLDGITSIHLPGYADILIVDHVQQMAMIRSLDRIVEPHRRKSRDGAECIV